MEKYVINTSTLIIINKNNYSMVIENDQQLIVNKTAKDIIEDSCNYYGSSLKGRISGSKNLIGVGYKCPIIINENKSIIFFPTSGLRDNNCIWISLNNIEKYYVNELGKTEIIFKNNYKITLLLSLGIIDRQILRATRLLAVLNGRKWHNYLLNKYILCYNNFVYRSTNYI